MNIKNSPSGTVITSPSGYQTYVPHPLPPEIGWNNELVWALSQATFVLGKLAREGNRLPNPHLLMRPFIAREAVLSSKIEGTQATIGEILAFSAGASIKPTADLQEVYNYISALDFGLQRLQELPLSLRLLKEIHAVLMHNVRGDSANPGQFRKLQNWIGSPGSTIQTAKFVPPPVDKLEHCLHDFELFLHNRQLPPLIHIALCHYQFETIHPFLDGNGRIGRLLITLLLLEHQLLPTPLLYLSAFFEADKDAYYTHLFNVSSKGSWHEWLTYFLNGVTLQSEDALSRAERINSLLDTWKLQVADTSSAVPIKLIEQCAVNPYLTTKKMAQELDIAYSTAQRAIEKLEAQNIVRQVGNNKRDKLYCATQILTILEEPTQLTIF